MRAWPFLIARGRRRGYSVLLAPDFLVTEQDYGFLEDNVRPLPGSAPFAVAGVTSPRGRPVCLVWADHTVTEADLDGGSTRDEHSRPLRLMTGFLCSGKVSEPSTEDIDKARADALETYRRFLEDEEHFAVESSAAFEAVSAGTPKATPPPDDKPRFWMWAGLAGLVVGGAVTTVVLLSGSEPEKPVNPCAQPTTGLAVLTTGTSPTVSCPPTKSSR
ncbi:hypothetical protein SAMN05421504_10485 [Amycolatopsis xylanica]|uniref:Uncharacterized protein n=1 Tax=Amycolatopsis xylanica TaxID=589385 RepID=A0A1H3G1Y1_9PSEU|nr:hypothetical protein [Amycolatopsis xylanica]SDX97125.1 hypothetical protein SAMN05421504_10485 [Amycolatopsis xylanica]